MNTELRPGEQPDDAERRLLTFAELMNPLLTSTSLGVPDRESPAPFLLHDHVSEVVCAVTPEIAFTFRVYVPAGVPLGSNC